MALEMAYLTTPAVYDRNAATRRGEARAKLRKETGLDDTQLEGWRIIFDRNVSPSDSICDWLADV